MTTAEKVRIFLFGVFELWSGRRNLKLKNNLIVRQQSYKARSFIAQRTFIAHCQGVVRWASRRNVCSIPPLCGLKLAHSAYWCLPESLPADANGDRYRFFPLVAHHHQLLLERCHIISAFSRRCCIKRNDAATMIKQ